MHFHYRVDPLFMPHLCSRPHLLNPPKLHLELTWRHLKGYKKKIVKTRCLRVCWGEIVSLPLRLLSSSAAVRQNFNHFASSKEMTRNWTLKFILKKVCLKFKKKFMIKCCHCQRIPFKLEFSMNFAHARHAELRFV